MDNANRPHAAHRVRIKECWLEAVKLLCIILGNDSVSTMRYWEDKKEKVEEAIKRMEDMMRKEKFLEGCRAAVTLMLRIILGDENISTTTSWEEILTKAADATKQLEDPQFGLNMLKEKMKGIISGHMEVKEAFQEIELGMQLLEISVSNQDYTGEINGKGKTLNEIKKDQQSQIEELAQANEFCDQKMQLLAYVKHLNTALKILSNECNSWCTKVIDSVDSENLVQEYFMQTKVEQFILHSHPVPDSIQISQNGKKDNIHSSKIIYPEKAVEEVIFGLTYVEGRPEKLTLKRQTSDQKMVPPARLNPESSNRMGASGDSGDSEDLESWINELLEGSSDAGANHDNMKLLQEKTPAVPGPVDIQCIITSLAAELDRKIESNPEMRLLEDIIDTEAKLQNIMTKLAKARKKLEDQAEMKRLEEEIKKEEVDLNKKKFKLARMQKRPRVM